MIPLPSYQLQEEENCCLRRVNMTSLRVLQKFSLLRSGLSPAAVQVHNNGISSAFHRGYSQYPPAYIDPLYSKSKQKQVVDLGEEKDLQFKPIKAALVFQNDSIFHDPLVAKFTNYVMKTGQRTLARELMTQTFEKIKRIQLEKKHQAETPEEKAAIEANPLKIFHDAVENCRPVLQVTPVKRGGIRYQVPVPLTEKRSYFVAMRWLVEAGNEKFRTVHFPEKLAKELLDAAKNEGRVVKKKQDLHRQCEANKAYAHYRWS